MTMPTLTSSQASTSPKLYPSSLASTLRGLKSNSTSHLPTLSSSATATAKQLAHDRSRSDTVEFNTLSRTPTPHSNGGTSTPTHPDLANEVATLSTKLVNAINHQTTLDDSLQRSRHELNAAYARIAQLESAAQQHDDLVATGALIERTQSDAAEQTLKSEVAEERLKRMNAEREKRSLELELEKLTGELFEEANTMVADARKESQQSEQQKEQLKARLEDTQLLMVSQQDQLRELKDVLQQMQAERSEDSSQQQQQPGSTPSTPVASIMNKQHSKRHSGALGSLHLQQSSSNPQPVYPDHPLSFTSLILPVLRSDLQSFDEFMQLLKMGNRASPSSRANSGNFVGLNVMGLGSLANPAQSRVEKASQSQISNSQPASASASSSSTPQPIPGSFNTNSPTDTAHSFTLKDSKYYRRALTEDIEPTLRLDAAPGLSWLARRSVVSSMITGNLIVEPIPASSKQWSSSVTFPCSLCNETREGETYVRNHHFKVNDDENTSRHALCDFCVGRLRATADFVNFLRMVRSGYWRGENVEDTRLAWEECVRLRERMFWARLGGGVVPASAVEIAYDTPRRSHHANDSSISEAPLGVASIPEEQFPTGSSSVSNIRAEEQATQSGAVESIEQPLPELGPITPPTTAETESTDPEKRPKSRGKSVEALRNRFENAAASAKAELDDTRSVSKSRSRTPSPQKAQY